MPHSLEILAVTGMGEITPGTDLAAAIVEAAPWLRDDDILVVTSKIVSKAEGRLVELPPAGPDREAAREEVLQAETARPVARRGPTRIVQTHHGFVMASAGIDASNVDRSRLVLLPKDPDASARALRAALRERFGLVVAVIVSDTMGRPWRNGLTDVALGAAGIAPIRDHRGETDPYGNELHITQVATIDELSAAADLVKGKCDQVPVAVVRGYLHRGRLSALGTANPGTSTSTSTGTGPRTDHPSDSDTGRADEGPGAVVLVRSADQDLFSLGTAEARAEGLRRAAHLADVIRFGAAPAGAAAVDPAVVVRSVEAGPDTTLALTEWAAFRAAGGARVAATAEAVTRPPTHVLTCAVANDAGDAASYVRLGEDIHRVRCALAAAGLVTTRLSGPDAGLTHTEMIAIGWPAETTS